MSDKNLGVTNDSESIITVDTSTFKQIDEMKAELEQAGYIETEMLYAKPQWHLSKLLAYHMAFSDIDEAYRHLKQSQFLARLAELRERYFSKRDEELQAKKQDKIFESRIAYLECNDIEQDIVNLVLGYKDE